MLRSGQTLEFSGGTAVWPANLVLSFAGGREWISPVLDSVLVVLLRLSWTHSQSEELLLSRLPPHCGVR